MLSKEHRHTEADEQHEGGGDDGGDPLLALKLRAFLMSIARIVAVRIAALRSLHDAAEGKSR